MALSAHVGLPSEGHRHRSGNRAGAASRTPATRRLVDAISVQGAAWLSYVLCVDRSGLRLLAGRNLMNELVSFHSSALPELTLAEVERIRI